MRKQFFKAVDSVLPRWVALLPYILGLVVVRLIMSIGMDSRVWNRNSTRIGTFVFGVSDLDLTVLARGSVSNEMLNYTLKTLKKLVIFLGETNLYHQAHLGFILARINPLELKRDPFLQAYAPAKAISTAHKFVFVQRMLFSDYQTLKNTPELRQPKWRNHMEFIGYDLKGRKVDLNLVMSVLKELGQENQKINDSLEKWASLNMGNFDVFQQDFGEGFRILAPHCYLWFHHRDDSDFLINLNDFEKEIIQCQIEWEFWGIYTQRYHLDPASVKTHLKRLLQVYSLISSAEEASKLEQEVRLAF